jgi:hypothetical protein
MDDSAYKDLKVHMTIIPESHKWPPPDYTHWEKLHLVADEARSRVSKAFASLDEVDRNPDLTAEGKAKERVKLAERAVADFQKSNALENARAAVQRQQAYWANKIQQAITPATDNGTAVMYAQIRDRVSSMDEKSRLSFIDRHIDNVAVVSAVLLAPEFLSGLSPVEVGVVKQKLAKRILSPETAEAKEMMEKAMAAAEKGWTRATEAIAERGGLAKASPVKKVA